MRGLGGGGVRGLGRMGAEGWGEGQGANESWKRGTFLERLKR